MTAPLNVQVLRGLVGGKTVSQVAARLDLNDNQVRDIAAKTRLPQPRLDAAFPRRPSTRSSSSSLDAERAKLGLKKRGRPKGSGTGSGGNLGAVRAAEHAWLDGHGVTAADVRKWASEQGMQVRGSVLSRAVRDAYDQAHPLPQAADNA